ncbi:MAG TPA: acetyl-CoA carboxylase carboxyl transferase subunit alpha, partial [Thermoanaerobaculia bacterium]|nr:acetyl-CoA carboxylase carboxyl transferase subunit alpha [Thermoanaerobaculia bacterium]
MNGEDGNFEEPIQKLRRRIEELSALPDDASHRREIDKLREKLDRVSKEIYASLTPWQKTLVARHPARPYTLDYVTALMTDFVELHGDRKFAEDAAIVAGFAFFRGQPVAVIGHQKGRDTKEKIRRNFG